MSKHKARIKKAEKELRVEEPQEIVIVWVDEEDLQPPKPGEIIITWEDAIQEA